jgi:hypothetical protein
MPEPDKKEKLTLESLKALVSEEQHADFDAIMADVKKSGDSLSELNGEKFNELLKGEHGPELKKILDQRFATGLKTWQENNLDKIYQERYAKENPEETDEQKRLKALEIEVAESKRREVAANLRADAVTELTKRSLPTELADFMIGDSQEKTLANIGILESVIKAREQNLRTELLKENGRKVTKQEDPDAEKYYSEEQLNNMSMEEFAANEEKVKESLKYHQRVS